MRWAAGILGREGRKITTRDMEFFLTKTGTDMGNIRNELEKLITFTMGRDVVTAEDIEEICTTRTENKIFEMVRAVTEKNQRKALDLYNDLLTLREPPMRILFLLSKQFRQMTLAKKMSGEGAAQSEIASRLGVPSFAVRNLLTCARAYSTEELEQAEVDFVDSEEAVKTGRLQDVLSVELLIVKYSSADRCVVGWAARLWKGDGAWWGWCEERLRGGEMLGPELSAKTADTGRQTRCAQTEPPCICNAAISSPSISNHPCRSSPHQPHQVPVHRLPHMLARGVKVEDVRVRVEAAPH